MRKFNIEHKRSRKTEIILSVILIFFPLLFLKSKFEDLNVEQNGKIVLMKIVHKPLSCLGTKAHWNMKAEYQGKIYLKQIGGQFLL